MKIEREKEFVHQFHYDARNLEWEKENGTPETNLNVQFQLVENAEGASEADTAITAMLTFIIVLENLVISGHLSQLSYIRDLVIENREQLDQEKMQELAAPLFDLLNRLTYEVTEIALDEPGINLEFWGRMKTAIITDSSAYLSDDIRNKNNVFVLDVPVFIAGETYIEGKNLTVQAFYDKMAVTEELPKTSQPSISDLVTLLEKLQADGYTHVIGLFLSSGISGFWQNIQYLKDEFQDLTLFFPDTLITSAPLGYMVEMAYNMIKTNAQFDFITSELTEIIDQTTAFIIVDDLDHLVKGGRLSNGAAMIGNLLNIKPILRFDEEGKIVVYEKIRTSKKAFKRLYKILAENTKDRDYKVYVIHSNIPEKAHEVAEELTSKGFDVSIASFGAVIGTHLGEGALGFGMSPKLK